MLWNLPNPLHARRFHLHIWVKSLRHCLMYQGGAVFTQEFYLSFFDADEFVDLLGFAVEEVGDLGLFWEWRNVGNSSTLNSMTLFMFFRICHA